MARDEWRRISPALQLAGTAGLLLALLAGATGCGIEREANAAPPATARSVGVTDSPLNRQPLQPKCVEASSVISFTSCKDPGNFPSTCASVTCPAGTILTGGGGACAAGNSRLKSLIPNLAKNQFGIMCDPQGVAPQVTAICCHL